MSIKRFICGLMAATAIVSFQPAANAAAGETSDWTRVAGWRVMVDHTTSNSCFAVQRYQRGTIMRIGYNINDRRIYLLFGRDDVNGVEEGKRYKTRFVFDNGARWYDTTVSVKNLDGISYLYHSNVGTEFMSDFAVYNNLKIKDVTGETIFNVSLANTYAAIEEVIHCQRAQNRMSTYEPRPAPAAPSLAPNDNSTWTAALQINGRSIKVEGMLNDRIPVQFVLDTGASGVSISRTTANQIGAREIRKQTVVYADGRRGQVSVVIIPRLTVGTATVTGLEATISEGDDVDALLGKNFLDAFSSYEIDNKRNQLVLRK
jgi:clan AA aspartic protease (TIGR02281 family)